MEYLFLRDFSPFRDKKLVIYGIGEESRKLFMVLFNEDVFLDHFVAEHFEGNHILGKEIITIKKLAENKESYRLLVPWKIKHKAKAIIEAHGLQDIVIDPFQVNPKLKAGEPVVIYGTGQRAEDTYQILSYYGIQIKYFCDSNSEKWGREFCGSEIFSPQKMENGVNHVVIASEAVEPIMQTLKNYVIENIFVNDVNPRSFQISNFNTGGGYVSMFI